MREQHKGGLIMKNKLKIGDEVYLISHKPYLVKVKDAMLDPFKATFIVEDVNYESNPADPLVTISRDGKSHIVRSKQLMVKAKIEIKKVRGGINMRKKFNVGDLVVNIDKDRIVKVNDGKPEDEDCFCGTCIAANTQFYVNDTDNCWLIDRFEIATKENTPKKWWKHLPATIADVAQEITNIMRGEDNMKDEFRIGDLALVKSCSSNNENYSRLIGCRGRIVDISADGKEYKTLFESLPDNFNVGNFHLHDCGEEDICKYIYILKLDVVPVDNPEPTLMISKDEKTLVEFIKETSSDHFKGTVLRNTDQELPLFKVGDSGSFWIKDAFEPATRDNVPSEWKHIIPEHKKIEEIKETHETKNEESSDNILKPRFQIVRMCKTKNQERAYAHALFTYMEEIVDGATYAFINSKRTGGVIYGKHANEMLEKLKQANPDKTFEVVVTQKNIPSNIKQISLKIIANKDVNYFVL